MAKRKKKAEKEMPMEDILWKAAEELRGAVEYPIYKNIVMPLIFLKFISDKFNVQRQKLLDDEEDRNYVEYPEFYNKDCVFFLEPDCRWEYIAENAKSGNIRLILDKAMEKIEDNNAILKGALPRNFYATIEIEDLKLASLIDLISMLNTVRDNEEDVIGRVYEYFMEMFSSHEGKGEFYTPKPIVKLIAEMIQPLHGQVFDPCCGSGGMFVQSMKIVEAHKGHRNDVSLVGQEYSPTTLKLAKMNMAIRGIYADFGSGPSSSLTNDQHKDLRADFVMANPPFNQKKWGAEQVQNDPRWVYGIPPDGNANYAWIQHFLYHLNEHGVAGFVLANIALTASYAEAQIRKNLVEKPIVDCIVTLPDKLFYTVGNPVSLWFCSKSKARRKDQTRDQILFIDCNDMGRLCDTTHRTIDDVDIQKIADTYHNWLSGKNYSDVVGFCKAVPITQVAESNYMLTPGRYVGLTPGEEDHELFESKMLALTQELEDLFEESHELEARIRENLNSIGFKI